MDATPILPQLLVGCCPESPADIDALARQHAVTAVLNVQSDSDIELYGIDWEEFEAHYQQAGIQVCRVPIEDFSFVALTENLPQCVRAVMELIDAGNTVYVHCNIGWYRSPTVVIAYLHVAQGQPLEIAAEQVERRRACDPDLSAIEMADWDGEPNTPGGQGA